MLNCVARKITLDHELEAACRKSRSQIGAWRYLAEEARQVRFFRYVL